MAETGTLRFDQDFFHFFDFLRKGAGTLFPNESAEFGQVGVNFHIRLLSRQQCSEPNIGAGG
jgi:hypothetical protein